MGTLGTGPHARTRSARRRRRTQPQPAPAYNLQWRTYGYAVAVMAVLFLTGAVFAWQRPLTVVEGITRLRLAYAGYHSEFTTIDGNAIHYYEGGSASGAPVVLVHGLGSRAEDWANLMPPLKDAGFHVYAVDMLGYGRSARPEDAPYSIQQEAGIVAAFLAQRGLHKVNLVGWSMGGWVAARVALDQPERVARLVLCDAAGIRFEPSFTIQDFEPVTIPAVRSLYRLLMPKPTELPDFLARDMIRKFQSLNWVVDRSARSMFGGADLLDGKLQSLTMPTLIVWGRQDHLIPLSTGVAMHAQMPQSVLEIYDGCGHLAPGQCASRIGPRLIDFLRGGGPQGGATVAVPAS